MNSQPVDHKSGAKQCQAINKKVCKIYRKTQDPNIFSKIYMAQLSHNPKTMAKTYPAPGNQLLPTAATVERDGIRIANLYLYKMTKSSH